VQEIGKTFAAPQDPQTSAIEDSLAVPVYSHEEPSELDLAIAVKFTPICVIEIVPVSAEPIVL